MKITLEAINMMIAPGAKAPADMEPFIIIHSRDSLRGSREYGTWLHHVIPDNVMKTNGDIKNEIKVSASTAQFLIDRFNMDKVVEEDDGEIYEMAGRPYKTKYSKGIQYA